MGPKPCLEIVVESFTNNLKCCNKQCSVDPSSIIFFNIPSNCFLWWGKCLFNLSWSLLLSLFYFLLHDFISNFFLQCFYLNITKYWFDVTTCELKYSIKGYLPCILLVGNIGRDNRLVNFATFGFALE